jgi:hypothetical protein
MQPGFAYGQRPRLVSYELLTYPLLQLDCLPLSTTKRQRNSLARVERRDFAQVDEQQVINKGAQVKWRSD